jgi:hypothetical protein
VLDWLTENDIAVNERSGSHRALFDQYLTPDPYSAIAGGSKP